MFPPKYVWILPLLYNNNFWHVFRNSSCPDEIMLQILNGTIGTVSNGYIATTDDTTKTFSRTVSTLPTTSVCVYIPYIESINVQ